MNYLTILILLLAGFGFFLYKFIKRRGYKSVKWMIVMVVFTGIVAFAASDIPCLIRGGEQYEGEADMLLGSGRRNIITVISTANHSFLWGGSWQNRYFTSLGKSLRISYLPNTRAIVKVEYRHNPQYIIPVLNYDVYGYTALYDVYQDTAFILAVLPFAILCTAAKSAFKDRNKKDSGQKTTGRRKKTYKIKKTYKLKK